VTASQEELERLEAEILRLCKESFDDGARAALDSLREVAWMFPGLTETINAAQDALRVSKGETQ
jgi:hypothetical protein